MGGQETERGIALLSGRHGFNGLGSRRGRSPSYPLVSGPSSDGKLRVGADSNQLQDVSIALAVDEDEVWPKMAVAAVVVLALHRMVDVAGWQRHIGHE